MIEVETSFRKLLLTEAPALTAMVSERVYLGIAEQSERRPRIVLTVLSKQYGHHFEGADEVVKGMVQITCLAPDYATAHQVAAAVHEKLDGYVGAGVTMQTVFDFIEIEEHADIQAMTPPGQPHSTWGVALTARFMAHSN